MAEKKNEKKILRGLPGSTEAAARRVLNEVMVKKKKPKPVKDTGGRTTAKTIVKKKTKAQAAKSLAEVRASIAKKVEAAKKKAAAKKKKKVSKK